MEITLIAFGIAKDILGSNQLKLQTTSPLTVGTLKATLLEQYPALMELKSLAIAVNEEYREDDWALAEQDDIVLIPPVSGG